MSLAKTVRRFYRHSGESIGDVNTNPVHRFSNHLMYPAPICVLTAGDIRYLWHTGQYSLLSKK